MEVHDVLTECARLALDTTEATQEDISLYSFPMKSPAERRGSKARALLQQMGRTSSPIVPSSKREILKLNFVSHVVHVFCTPKPKLVFFVLFFFFFFFFIISTFLEVSIYIS